MPVGHLYVRLINVYLDHPLIFVFVVEFCEFFCLFFVFFFGGGGRWERNSFSVTIICSDFSHPVITYPFICLWFPLLLINFQAQVNTFSNFPLKYNSVVGI